MFKIRFVNEGYEVILYMFGPWIQHTCYFLDRSGRSIFLFNLVSENRGNSIVSVQAVRLQLSCSIECTKPNTLS